MDNDRVQSDVCVCECVSVGVCLGVGVRGDECDCSLDEGVTESWSRPLGNLEGLAEPLQMPHPLLLVGRPLTKLAQERSHDTSHDHAELSDTSHELLHNSCVFT